MSLKEALTKVGFLEEEIPVAKPKAPANLVQAPLKVDTTPPPASGSVDPTFQAMLLQSFQKHKQTGFDYLKFISAVGKMKAKGSSAEDSCFQMAFMAASELGVDKSKLIESGQYYLDVLKGDEADFNTDLSSTNKTEVEARQQRVTQIEGKLTDLSKQLAALQQEHDTLVKEIHDTTTKLSGRQDAFQVTVASIRSEIETNIKKINQYLT
jgi:hypothetical protein